MKHKIQKRTLGRKAHHRQYLLKNLLSGLLTNGSLVTTQAKAKELAMYTERLLSHSKRELTLHNRRQLLRALNSKKELELLRQAGQNAGERTSGFVRLTKLPRRAGDGASLMRVDLIDAF